VPHECKPRGRAGNNTVELRALESDLEVRAPGVGLRAPQSDLDAEGPWGATLEDMANACASVQQPFLVLFRKPFKALPGMADVPADANQTQLKRTLLGPNRQ